MLALFALAQHDSLMRASHQLHEDDQILAFLDDIYVVTNSERAQESFRIVTSEIEAGAGVRTHGANNNKSH